MAEVTYNKLVRDKIPEIIRSRGADCEVEVLSPEEYLAALDRKLDEELAEYHADRNLEELADLLEVIAAVAAARGATLAEIEAIRAEKARQRGGFEKRLFLKRVME